MSVKKNIFIVLLFFLFPLIFPDSKIFAIKLESPAEIIAEAVPPTFFWPEGVTIDSVDNIIIVNTQYSNIAKYDKTSRTWTLIGSSGTGPGQFEGPEKVSVDEEGNMYVVEFGNHRIQKYNLSLNTWSIIGTQGTGPGQFSYPKGISIDSQKNIYVADTYNSRIQKYDVGTSQWTIFGAQGTGPGQFSYPNDITVDGNNNIYVSDTSNHRIQKYDIGTTSWSILGSQGTSPGQFNSPMGIYADNNENIYVSDLGNHRIQKYTVDTGTWTTMGSMGTNTGEFQSPAGIFVDQYNNIFVADSHNNRIQKYSVITQEWTAISKFGNGLGQFYYPGGIAISEIGDIYVADGANNRVQIFDIGTSTWTALGVEGTGPGEFKMAQSVDVDSQGNIYVADLNNNRIQKYNIGTSTWTVMGSPGSQAGQFDQITSIDVDNNGNIFIVDSMNRRIQKYNIGTTSWSVLDNYISQVDRLAGCTLACPWAISVDTNNNYFVIEKNSENGRLIKYNNQTGLWSVVADFGSEIGKLKSPSGIKIDNNNNLYIADSGNHRIQKYDINRNQWEAFGVQGEDFGQFSMPEDVAIDSYGNVYVVDSENHRLSKFMYYDLAQYSSSDNGAVNGSTTQKLSNNQTGTTVAAIPASGYRFLTWSDGVKDNPRVDVGGSGAISAVARFGQPQKEITTLSPSVLADEVTSYHISIASTNPAATPNFTFNTNYTFKAGDAEIVFPADTVVTSTEGGNLDLTQFATTENTDTVKATLTQALASVQVGIPNAKLTFSKPVTITIPVGASYNGQTLEIKYKREGEDTWNVEGSCLVASGNCTFQTTHATTFAALEPVTSSSNESNSSNATSVSVSSTPDHNCHSSKPLFTSDLFQINTTTNSAKIYFTPQADTNNYVISFSTNSNAEEHGEQVSLLREGVQSHSIYYLKPNTTYYVKVRGQNGCMPGEWSNIMKFKTNSSIYYKSGLTTFVSNVKSLVKNTVTKKTDTDTKTDDLKEDNTTISTDTSSNQTNNKTVETSSSTNQQRTETPKAKKCFLWWCW